MMVKFFETISLKGDHPAGVHRPESCTIAKVMFWFFYFDPEYSNLNFKLS
jgi:hypothetical protein